MKQVSDQSLAYALLRIALGINFFGHGFVRVVGGVSKFADGITKGFEESILPPDLVRPFALAIPYIEIVIGIFLILGLFSRWTYIVGALFMMMLTFGSAMKSDWTAVSMQLTYSIVYSALLFLRKYNQLSIDSRRAIGE